MGLGHHSTPYHLFINQNDVFYGRLSSSGSAIGQLGFSCFPSFWECWGPGAIPSHHSRRLGLCVLGARSLPGRRPPILGRRPPSPTSVRPVTVSDQSCFLPWGGRSMHAGWHPARSAGWNTSSWYRKRMKCSPWHRAFSLGIATLKKPLRFPGTVFSSWITITTTDNNNTRRIWRRRRRRANICGRHYYHLSAFCERIHLNLSRTCPLPPYCHYAHFLGEETEAQEG